MKDDRKVRNAPDHSPRRFAPILGFARGTPLRRPRNLLGGGCLGPRQLFTALITLTLILSQNALRADWQVGKGRLLTRWAKDVSPQNAHPEYPRPQLTRSDWLNLNGLWDYAITDRGAERPAEFGGQILVPFPIESALSGVMKPLRETQRLWYRRIFQIPESWQGKKVLLHFGAVDWESTVTVNGKELGTHRGGYDGFSFDISNALKPAGDQEIVVAVFDPTDAGSQPRGKQVRDPNGIWYTPTSGIWQTVWLEPVSPDHIEALRITPDVDSAKINVAVTMQLSQDDLLVNVAAFDGEREIAAVENAIPGPRNGDLVTRSVDVSFPHPKLWSPDSPFLYTLRVQLTSNGKVVDQVGSYAGLRKIAVTKDADGTPRLYLNNQPLFQLGPLDQGFWPDGLYTAPTDEALRFDIEMTKKVGMNMARKHVKVEPDRWYYWCDKLGLLVWQDMPSGDKYIGTRDPDIQRTPESGKQFETELKALITGRVNHPSIVMWVPFNEGWGQWDTARIVDLVKRWDSTRLVDNASGWTDRHVGDVNDIHSYPGPSAPGIESNRAGVLGEFGGLGLPVPGHTWQEEKNWGYRSYKNSEELTDAYVRLLAKLHPLTGVPGLSAAVYTQTTDVEVEVNGLMTYDREVVKLNETAITKANQAVYAPPPGRQQSGAALVPPATPLIACDPYFSVWSPSDTLTGDDTIHWTGRPHRLSSLIRIDGKTFRVMGAEPPSIPALAQKSVLVLPTRTVYSFEGGGITLSLTFLTPAIPEDIDLLSRPITYITYDVRATDGQSHEVAIYFDAGAELAVNQPRQAVEWQTETIPGLSVIKVGSRDQPILAKRGDDLRIDWGYLYLATPQGPSSQVRVVPASAARKDFAARGSLAGDYGPLPGPSAEASGVGAINLTLGSVSERTVSRWLLLAYDDLYSIQYMQHNLRPYWRRHGWEAADLLTASLSGYDSIQRRCAAFDKELMADLTAAGGDRYARICALAFRQCFAAGKFVADENGQPLSFCKENFSNGCIATSDVFYPMAPQFLLFGSSVAKSFLVPFMNYANSPRWKFPFAPHDLGTYPHANGQVYGGGERTEENQMPVEETGNLLILLAAVSQIDGNTAFATPYWPLLERWADYLKAKGFDPENQLCTDDFAGHLAHNVNLSAKAICGLGAFAKMCEMRGDRDQAAEYRKVAKEFADRWIKEADDGDHFRLAFDRPGSWSQKYNLIWDKILGLNLWPAEVLRKEMNYYKSIQNKYGLPLDNRETYTKLDWILWTATLTQDRSDFQALVDPVFKFLNETYDRSPMTDWYQTKSGRRVGFTARPVVGGVFAQMLYNKSLWTKWAARDVTKAANWAPLPVAPKTAIVIPTSEDVGLSWNYTTQRPAQGWNTGGFDASSWAEGPGGFGTAGTPGAVVRTVWNTPDIWLRREITLPDRPSGQLQFRVHHDEDVEIYIDGVLAGTAQGFTSDYESLPINANVLASLKPGKHLLAVHCRQTAGGQYIDVGLTERVAAQPRAAAQKAIVPGVQITPDPRGSLYIGNRAPLRPSPFVRLPIGSITPRGWLRQQLALEADGMTGRLPEVSKWCQFEGNAWASPTGQGHSGWEELPYWLKGFGDLGYVLKDERIIEEARRWIEAVLSSQEPSGWFGPRALKTSLEGKPDLWPHMVMLNVLQSFYEYSQDERVIPFMLRYHRWLNGLPASTFGNGYWPKIRFGDNIETAYWLYNRTGEAWLLELTERIHRNMQDWTTGVHNWHNVNVSQGFREPGVYYVQAQDEKFLQAAERNYQTVRDLYGQFPGGGFAGDENCRPGYTDPRQGFETCGIVEFMHSFEMLNRISANPVWLDRCEELAFNSLPAALTPDWKGLHYLTCANQIQLDKNNKSPAIENSGTMFSYSPFEVYRCCQHNVSHGWPYYAEELWLGTADRGLCAALYAASEVTAKVGDNHKVTISETTDYPFSETVTLRLSCSGTVEFPLYLRIPGWCKSASVKVNGQDVSIETTPLSYARLSRTWHDGDTVILQLPMAIAVRRWTKNHDAASVDYGPLSFSLQIGEKWTRYGNNDAWPEWQVFASTPWNFGLLLPDKDPASAFQVVRKPGPMPANPFTADTVPLRLKGKGKRIPGWNLDNTGLIGLLQNSPIKTPKSAQAIELIPMGAARLRISMFPVLGDGENAREWVESKTPVEVQR